LNSPHAAGRHPATLIWSGSAAWPKRTLSKDTQKAESVMVHFRITIDERNDRVTLTLSLEVKMPSTSVNDRLPSCPNLCILPMFSCVSLFIHARQPPPAVWCGWVYFFYLV